MEVFNNKYCVLSYADKSQTLDQIWSAETENMTIEDYKNIQLNTVKQFKDNCAKRIYVYLKDFRWPIVPDIQIWTNYNIIKPLINANILKISYIVPEEFITQLSMEQTLEEDEEQKFPYKYFTNEKEARDWLLFQKNL